MKSFKDTLLDVIQYAKIDCDDLVTTLLLMGFTPEQLIKEFDFDEEDVKASEIYDDVADALEDIPEDDYPFNLDQYEPFDAALVSRYIFSREEMSAFKVTPTYQKIFEEYEERVVEVENELFDEIFDEFEDEILEGSGKTVEQIIQAAADRNGVEYDGDIGKFDFAMEQR